MGQINRDIISTSVQEKITVPLAGEIFAKKEEKDKARLVYTYWAWGRLSGRKLKYVLSTFWKHEDLKGKWQKNIYSFINVTARYIGAEGQLNPAKKKSIGFSTWDVVFIKFWIYNNAQYGCKVPYMISWAASSRAGNRIG